MAKRSNTQELSEPQPTPEPVKYTKFFVEIFGLPAEAKGKMVWCPECGSNHAWFVVTPDGGFVFKCFRKICDFNKVVGFWPAYKRPPGERVCELYKLLGGDPLNMNEYRFSHLWESMLETSDWFRELEAERQSNASPEAPQPEKQ